MPAAILAPSHDIDRAEEIAALGRADAVPMAGELMRHRDDDSIEIRHVVGGLEEGLEMIGRHADRRDDAVMAALGEGRGHAAGRFHLRDRLADDDVEAGRPGDPEVHGVVLGC